MNFSRETLKAVSAYIRAIKACVSSPGAPSMQRRIRAYGRAVRAGVHPQELRVLRDEARTRLSLPVPVSGSPGGSFAQVDEVRP